MNKDKTTLSIRVGFLSLALHVVGIMLCDNLIAVCFFMLGYLAAQCAGILVWQGLIEVREGHLETLNKISNSEFDVSIKDFKSKAGQVVFELENKFGLSIEDIANGSGVGVNMVFTWIRSGKDKSGSAEEKLFKFYEEIQNA